jgi:hypothetical protein
MAELSRKSGQAHFQATAQSPFPHGLAPENPCSLGRGSRLSRARPQRWDDDGLRPLC